MQIYGETNSYADRFLEGQTGNHEYIERQTKIQTEKRATE